MRFSEITPFSFRNLAPAPVFFGRGLHVIAGENGQGKTNLLEAAAFLCGQRSFRRARVAACASDGERFAVSGTIETASGSDRVRVEWSRESGKRFFRGEKTVGFRDVSAAAPAVFLAPEHRELVTGGPESRRRFVDRLVLGLRPAAGDDLVRFERALSERNALLAQARHRAPAREELETWTEEFADAAQAVRRRRAEALAEWRPRFEPLARSAGPEYAQIRVDYAAGDESAASLREACGRLLALELRRGHSLAGPHRDDLAFTRSGRPLAAEASSGEIQRTVALVKLAEWHAVAGARGEAPLLGVDDFDAGLSAASVEAFLEALPREATTLLTTASDPARWRRRATVLVVESGRARSTPELVAVAGNGVGA